MGSPLIFQGEWEGKSYQDKGNILASEPGKLLQYNYWSGFSGLEDVEEALAHADAGWKMVLDNLKKLLEL